MPPAASHRLTHVSTMGDAARDEALLIVSLLVAAQIELLSKVATSVLAETEPAAEAFPGLIVAGAL